MFCIFFVGKRKVEGFCFDIIILGELGKLILILIVFLEGMLIGRCGMVLFVLVILFILWLVLGRILYFY